MPPKLLLSSSTSPPLIITQFLPTPFLRPPKSSPFLFTPLKIPSFYKKAPLSRPRFFYKNPPLRPSAFRTSSSPSAAAVSSDGAPDGPAPPVFGPKKELSALQAAVDALSPPARLAASAAIVAAAVASGFALGSRLGGTRTAALVAAVAAGAAGSAAAYVVNSCVPGVAAVSLHNLVAGCDDPTVLRREDVDGIAARYGVSKEDEAFNAELCDLYSQFVTSVLPPGNENLKGSEVETIVKFKNALGIDDPDAAAVHMEIGRRIFRQRLETGDRDADVEQRRAFQKLVYVSTLVFGEASTFLLPWKRVLKVTDSQVEIAVRDNAQRLYSTKLMLINKDVDESQLTKLREAQLLYRLSDEIAADMFGEQARKLVEENISAALEILKSRTRAIKESSRVVELVDQILVFNDSLVSLSKHPEVGRFAPGIRPVSLVGGKYDNDRRIDDLKLLYKAYVTESFSAGRIEESKLVALNQLKKIFGLGNLEADKILLDITSTVYRRRLSQAVSSGTLEAADSKAAFLQKLCDELHFDPAKASQIHEDIYQQKLQKCVASGELSDEDASSLLRLRVMLCIPQEIVDAAHADICGRLFEKVVKDAILAGVEGYDAEVRATVRKASQGLRLKRDAAMAIASKAVRLVFITYIKRSKAAESKKEAALELKKMIKFNILVVTDLIADVKGQSVDAPSSPVKEQQVEDIEEDEWESLQTLRKTRPNKELEAKLGKPGQTELTLRDDLSERDRADLYRTYLLFCLQGNATAVPFGIQITTKKDDSEYIWLHQLGGILGMTDKEIVEVHRSLAEQAFKQQAQIILADGQVTKARMEQLSEVRKQVGLPAEAAQQVIKSITTTKLAATIETAVAQGRMSVKQMRELQEVGVDVNGMISERLREEIFNRTVSDFFSSGTGEFDANEIYEKIPSDLNIDAEKAKGVVHELAKNRLSDSLIQAVALLRRKRPMEVVSSLNDLLACDKAVPADPLSWQVPEELLDLFCIYVKSDSPSEKISRLQYLLGISDKTAEELWNRIGSGDFKAGDEEEAFIF